MVGLPLTTTTKRAMFVEDCACGAIWGLDIFGITQNCCDLPHCTLKAVVHAVDAHRIGEAPHQLPRNSAMYSSRTKQWMKGMKAKLTSAKTRNDPDSRINKSLRAWEC